VEVLKAHRVRVRGAEGARPMIFAHGLGCDQLMWRHVAPAFEDDHRVVLLDHVGHGGASRDAFDPERHAALAGYADDVVAICEALDLHDAVFVGHSTSAMIGVLAALAAPERFAALALVAPSPRFIDDGDYVGGFSAEQIQGLLAAIDADWEQWAQSMAPVIMGNPDHPDLGAQLTSSFCRTDHEIVKLMARATFLADCREDVTRVGAPSLILQCSQDAIAPLPVGEFLAAAMPDAQLHVLAATGHCPHVSAPAETRDAIRGFLDRLDLAPHVPRPARAGG
jgi:sigma-B regulation protein RsbQ